MFTSSSCILLHELSIRKLLELGKLDQGLYKLIHKHSNPGSGFHISVFNENIQPKCVFDVSFNKVVQNKSVLNSIALVPSNDVHSINKHDVLWHYRLGQNRLHFSHNTYMSNSSFELIHVNTWGPYHTHTYSGDKNFLTIVNDHSRATWTRLMQSKTYAFSLLKSFISMIKTQFNLPVKTVRSDGALKIGLSNSALQ